MKIMPVRYTDDLAALARFCGALGLTTNTASRAGSWVDLTADGGMLGLHIASAAEETTAVGRCELSFQTDEPLEEVLDRLRAAGYLDAHIVDEAFGRSLRVTDPDGVPIQVDESDPSLYT